ncbi:GNAT family N-acetyltransferase [Spirosoma pulveris]
MVEIQRFDREDQPGIRAFVLNIQNNEFHLGLSEDDQPDLKDTAHYFSDGDFWTAKQDGVIIGSIGLKRLDEQSGVLKKMFVHRDFRGKELRIAQQLYETLLSFAGNHHIRTIWLDTPSIATAAHRFYERNGFVEVDKSSLPDGYKIPVEDSKVYKLTIA